MQFMQENHGVPNKIVENHPFTRKIGTWFYQLKRLTRLIWKASKSWSHQNFLTHFIWKASKSRSEFSNTNQRLHCKFLKSLSWSILLCISVCLQDYNTSGCDWISVCLYKSTISINKKNSVLDWDHGFKLAKLNSKKKSLCLANKVTLSYKHIITKISCF